MEISLSNSETYTSILLVHTFAFIGGAIEPLSRTAVSVVNGAGGIENLFTPGYLISVCILAISGLIASVVTRSKRIKEAFFIGVAAPALIANGASQSSGDVDIQSAMLQMIGVSYSYAQSSTIEQDEVKKNSDFWRDLKRGLGFNVEVEAIKDTLEQSEQARKTLLVELEFVKENNASLIIDLDSSLMSVLPANECIQIQQLPDEKFELEITDSKSLDALSCNECMNRCGLQQSSFDTSNTSVFSEQSARMLIASEMYRLSLRLDRLFRKSEGQRDDSLLYDLTTKAVSILDDIGVERQSAIDLRNRITLNLRRQIDKSVSFNQYEVRNRFPELSTLLSMSCEDSTLYLWNGSEPNEQIKLVELSAALNLFPILCDEFAIRELVDAANSYNKLIP